MCAKRFGPALATFQFGYRWYCAPPFAVVNLSSSYYSRPLHSILSFFSSLHRALLFLFFSPSPFFFTVVIYSSRGSHPLSFPYYYFFFTFHFYVTTCRRIFFPIRSSTNPHLDSVMSPRSIRKEGLVYIFPTASSSLCS